MPRCCIETAIRLAISRLQGDPELPVEPGDPSDTWQLHMLKAVLSGLNQPVPVQDAFYHLPQTAHSIVCEGILVGVKKSWCELLGYAPRDAVGCKSTHFLTEESQTEAIEKYLPKFWADGYIFGMPYDMVHKSGRIAPVLLSGVCDFDENHRPGRSFAVIYER